MGPQGIGDPLASTHRSEEETMADTHVDLRIDALILETLQVKEIVSAELVAETTVRGRQQEVKVYGMKH